MTGIVWLCLKDAEKLGVPLSTLKHKCSTGKFITRKVPSVGKTGFAYEVALQSLPDKCKRKFFSEHSQTIQIDQSEADIDTDPETESALVSTMAEWERDYIQRFLVLYEIAKTLKGNDLKLFLTSWCAQHPEYRWSYGSYMRIKAKYESAGCSVQAIRPQWGKRPSTVKSEWADIYEQEYLTQRQPSSYSCWKNVVGALSRKDPEFNLNTFPSHTSFYRKLQSKYSESVIFYMRNGLAKWKAKYGYSISRNYDDILCGEVWVSDHVQSDVAVSTPDGRSHFMWITVWIDVKSQKWLGWDVHLEAPNSSHIFKSFYIAAKKYGIPSDVIIDNGKDYRCKSLSGGRVVNGWHKITVNEMESISLFADPGLNISVHFAWPYNPESKICERTFGRVNSGFSRHCIGYRGPNITQRPDSLKNEIKKGDIWSHTDFLNAFDRYIIEVYNRDTIQGKALQGRCPDELFGIEWPQALKLGRAHLVSAEALKMFCSPLSNPIRIRKSVVEDKKLSIRYYAPWMASHNGALVRMRRLDEDYSQAYFWEDGSGTYLGTAELDGNVSALARTPVQKADLEERIRRKRYVEKSVKSIARTIVATDNGEFVENRIAGIAALNAARGYTPADPKASENYLITSMDRVIAENNRRKKNPVLDFVDEEILDNKKLDPLSEIDLWGTKAVNF